MVINSTFIMPRNPNPVASATKAIIRASPPLKTITKASISLNRAAISNRHYVRALLSLVATRNLIKSFFLFRPVNRKTLKPGSPLWKVFLKAVWMAIWPALGQGLAKRLVKEPVAEAVEVETCEEEAISIRPEDVKGALATYAAELHAIEVRAAESARAIEDQERAFQKEFAQVEELVTNKSQSIAVENSVELRAPEASPIDLVQIKEEEEYAIQRESPKVEELVMSESSSLTIQNTAR